MPTRRRSASRDQTLLDVRVGRRSTVSRGLSFEPLVEVYNLLNENASLTEVETVGADARAASPATSTAGWCDSASRVGF